MFELAQLCKYLPFDINMVIGHKMCKLTLELLLQLKNKEIEGLPVLRPFSEINKMLPLTKKAAELLGKQEGEPVLVYLGFAMLTCNNLDLRQKNCTTMFFHNKYAMSYDIHDVYYEDASLGCIRLYHDWTFTVINPSNRSTTHHFNTNGYDFLRAMHFAVDLQPQHYIKLYGQY